MWQRIENHKLRLVIAISVITRLVVLFAFPSVFAFSEPGAVIHGSEAYDQYALNLLETGVYGREAGEPDSILPPLYSYILAPIYGIFGRDYIAVGLVHILFDLASIALLYDIARRLLLKGAFAPFSEWIGALAALFFALYPYLIFQNLTLIDTPLWILLLHLFVWLMILLRGREQLDRGTVAIAILAGVVLGISALARALLPPLAILAVPWFLFWHSWRQSLYRLLPVAIVSALMLLPWLLRGYQIHGGFVAVALNSGENLYQGNNPQTIPIFRAGYDVQWSSRPSDLPKTDNEDRYAINNALADAGWRFLRENPGVIPELLLVKFQVYWNVQVTPLNNLRVGERLALSDEDELLLITDEGSHIGVTGANASYQDDDLFNVVGRNVHSVYFGGLWVLAILGAWWSRREWRELSLLIFVQISQTAVYLLFHPSTRYRSPTDPLLFVFSALAVVWLARWWRGRSSHHLPI